LPRVKRYNRSNPVIQRRAYGFPNEDYLRLKILTCLPSLWRSQVETAETFSPEPAEPMTTPRDRCGHEDNAEEALPTCPQRQQQQQQQAAIKIG
jgi:hypothetical protein